MQRFTMMLPENLLAKLAEAAAKCGCGSRSAHVRHLLTEWVNKE